MYMLLRCGYRPDPADLTAAQQNPVCKLEAYFVNSNTVCKATLRQLVKQGRVRSSGPGLLFILDISKYFPRKFLLVNIGIDACMCGDIETLQGLVSTG